MGLFNKKPKIAGSVNSQTVTFRKGMVFITPQGKTYHASCDCFGSRTDEYAEVPESAAKQAGFVRCKKCDWVRWERANR